MDVYLSACFNRVTKYKWFCKYLLSIITKSLSQHILFRRRNNFLLKIFLALASTRAPWCAVKASVSTRFYLVLILQNESPATISSPGAWSFSVQNDDLFEFHCFSDGLHTRYMASIVTKPKIIITKRKKMMITMCISTSNATYCIPSHYRHDVHQIKISLKS